MKKTKICNVCNIEKSLNCFYKHIGAPDGLRYVCKQCCKLYQTENKETISQHHKEYYIANKEIIAEKKKEYYEKNKGKINEQRKKHHKNNREKINEQKRKYYKINKEKIAEQGKKYRKNNQEKIAERGKKYRANNKEKIAEKDKVYGYQNQEKRKQYHKEYYENNKEQIAIKQKEYRKYNQEKSKQHRKEYYKNHKEKIAEKGGEYRKNNKEKIVEQKRKYYENNKEKIAKQSKGRDNTQQNKRRNSPTNKQIYFNKIPSIDKPKRINNLITIKCKMCGKRFAPTVNQINNRAACWTGKNQGESSFYCSNKCRNACPLFGFQSGKQTDPKSKLYAPKTEQQKVRACQTKTLKQMQCDEKGYNFCERCGDIIDVELHHTLPVAQFGREAINPAGHMLLCAGCHVKIHADCFKQMNIKNCFEK